MKTSLPQSQILIHAETNQTNKQKLNSLFENSEFKTFNNPTIETMIFTFFVSDVELENLEIRDDD